MKFNVLDLLLPRETKFFDYLDELSALVLSSCLTFQELSLQIENLSDEEIKHRIRTIRSYEKKGDQAELTIIEELCNCFITPLDREDLHTLTVDLNRPLNMLKDLAYKIETYRIRKMPPNVCRFAEIIVELAKFQQEIVHFLKTKETVRPKVEQMHALENKADELYRVSLAELFDNNETTLSVEILKFKEIYEMLEDIVDSLDEIGKMIRGIKIKHG